MSYSSNYCPTFSPSYLHAWVQDKSPEWVLLNSTNSADHSVTSRAFSLQFSYFIWIYILSNRQQGRTKKCKSKIIHKEKYSFMNIMPGPIPCCPILQYIQVTRLVALCRADSHNIVLSQHKFHSFDLVD